jgi:hypothetical protein
MLAAREFGEEDIAAAAQRSLDQDCQLSLDGGVRRYMRGSNLANISAATARLMRTGDFRRSFVDGPSDATLNGPRLTGVRYPDVLVARAYSRGDDLNLVLHPGAAPGRQSIGFEKLQPGRRYAVTGADVTSVVADQAGCARIDVMLAARTEVTVNPA